MRRKMNTLCFPLLSVFLIFGVNLPQYADALISLRSCSTSLDEETLQLFSVSHSDLTYEKSHDTSSHSINSRRVWLSKAAASAGTILCIDTWSSKPAIASISSLCDPSVSVLKNYSNSRRIYLLGTAHISSNSAQLAGRLVNEIRPDAVFVELDAKRVGRAVPSSNQGAVSTISTVPIPKSDRRIGSSAQTSSSTPDSLVMEATSAPSSAPSSKMGVFNLRDKAVEASSQIVGDAIRGLYKKLESEGFSAGEEFVVAVKTGQAIGSKIVLGDRDVDVTLKRLTEALVQTDLKKLFSESSELEQNMKKFLPESIRDIPNDASLSKDQLSEYVETLKAKENVKMIMANLKLIAPELYNAMVSERDEFMSQGLISLNQYRSIVAVMGVAHIDGVENRLIRQGWTKIEVSCPVGL